MQVIIAHESIRVNIDEIYRGLGCHTKGLPENRFCCRCRRHADRRMTQALAWIAVQGTRPPVAEAVVDCSRDHFTPMPAEAACYEVPPDAFDSNFDGFLMEPNPRPIMPKLTDRQLRDMAFLAAVEDFELEAIDV